VQIGINLTTLVSTHMVLCSCGLLIQFTCK